MDKGFGGKVCLKGGKVCLTKDGEVVERFEHIEDDENPVTGPGDCDDLSLRPFPSFAPSMIPGQSALEWRRRKREKEGHDSPGRSST